MNKIIVVGGPTATGKTKLAEEIAKKFNGELVNADSRQIYKDLNIGTNKEYPTGISIHLVDLITPDKRFSVFDYQQLAFKTIKAIWTRGKLPILVGGTGLYIESVINNYELQKNSEEDSNLRNELEQMTTGELQKLLFLKNPKAFDDLNESDRNNPRRLIRLIEKVETVMSADKAGSLALTSKNISTAQAKLPAFKTLFLYPKYNWKDLKLTIENRVEKMFKDGLVEETKRILNLGYSEDSPGLQVMGYSQVIKYLKGEFDLKKCIELVKFAHIHYAKRQRTWFEVKARNYKLVKILGIEQSFLKVSGFIDPKVQQKDHQL